MVKRITKSKKRAYRKKMINETTPGKKVNQIFRSIKNLSIYKNSERSVNNYTIDDPKMKEVIDKLKSPPDKMNIPKIPDITNGILDKEITKTEYYENLKLLKSKSAPGSENLSNDILLNLPEIVHEQLIIVFNRMQNEGVYPEQWREYLVILIPKPQGKGYRPIALAQNTMKLFESIIKTRIDWFAENNYLIPKSQNGFRKMKSCQDSTTTLAAEIAGAFSKNFHVGALFVDIQGAFDNVIPATLIEDLIEIGVSKEIINFIRFVYMKRIVKFYHNNVLVEEAEVTKGTPQGSVLSPLIFNLYLRKIEYYIANCNNLQFADDCVIYYKSSNPEQIVTEIQKGAKLLFEWLGTRGMQVSVKKTRWMLFSKRNDLAGVQINIDDKLIEQEEESKFLGVVFDRKLNWNRHINYIKNKAMTACNVLKAFAGTSWGAHPLTLTKVYKGYTRAILKWGIQCYCSGRKKDLESLEKVQNQALRIITGLLKNTSIFTLHKITDVPTLEARRNLLINKYLLKSCSIKGSIVIQKCQALENSIKKEQKDL